VGLFDSNSSTSNFNQTNNIKKDLVIGNQSQGFSADNGGTNNIQMLDGGAIANAFQFGDSAMNSAFALVKSNDVNQGKNYQDLLSTTSTALSGILGGIASTQNFIAGTAADAKGTLDNKTIMVIAGLAVAALGFAIYRGRA
jgi:hypothetical protein